MATSHQSLGVTSTSHTYADNLPAGSAHRTEKPIVIVSGAGALTRGTVLGIVTASGKYKVYDNAASDGSQVARGLLVTDVDATSGDVPVSMYVTGEFNKDAVDWGTNDSTGITAGTADLEALNLYLKEVKS